MKRFLARLVPDGLAARFALLLICALLAANLVALALVSSERDRLGRAARETREIERIVGLVPALEAVDPSLRRSIAGNASTRIARVAIDAAPAVDATSADRRSRALAARISESLGTRVVHAAIVEVTPLWQRHRREHSERRRQEAITVSIALETPEAGDWLNVVTRGSRRGPRGNEGRAFLIVLALSLATVLAVGLWFVRRLTRPLGALAEAARAAGKGDRSARVPEQGAREMRDAAGAFNAMQGQIAGFEAERMRTLAAVGHDLRTPITSLRIRAEMLEDDLRDPMVRTLDEMTVMADELVAFARGDGEAEETRDIDLSALLARLSQERGASFVSTQGVTVSGRSVALSRAFGNLIDNAIRYGGTARVTLSEENGTALVTIDDDGPGIAPERLTEMFEPFVRGEASRNTETGGAGLGLSIARQILRAHGGDVILANRPEGGLRATVTLLRQGMAGRIITP